MSNSGNYYFSNYFTKKREKGRFAIFKIANAPFLCHFCRHCHINVRAYVGKINNYIHTRYLINYFLIHISSMKTCGSCCIVAECLCP